MSSSSLAFPLQPSRKRLRRSPSVQNLGENSVQHKLGIVATETALSVHLLNVYFEQVGLGQFHLSPTGWQEHLLGCSSQAQELAPLEQCFTSLFISLASLVSSYPYLIGPSPPTPPWLITSSRTDGDLPSPLSASATSMEKIGFRRSNACRTLGYRAYELLEVHGVLRCRPSRTSAQLLAFAGAALELVLPLDVGMVREVKRAALGQIQEVASGEMKVDEEDEAFMLGPGMDETLINDSAFAALHDQFCLASPKDASSWLKNASILPPAPTFSPKPDIEVVHEAFWASLDKCHNKIGSIFRKIVDLRHPTTSYKPFETAGFKALMVDIDKLLLLLTRLYGGIHQYYFPSTPHFTFPGSIQAATTFVVAADFILFLMITQRHHGAYSEERENRFTKPEKDSHKRLLKGFRLFAKACGAFLKYESRRTIYLLQAFEVITKALPDWATLALSIDLTVQERIWLKEGARIASWSTPAPVPGLQILEEAMGLKNASPDTPPSFAGLIPAAMDVELPWIPPPPPPMPIRAVSNYGTGRLIDDGFSVGTIVRDDGEEAKLLRRAGRVVEATLRDLASQEGVSSMGLDAG